MDAIGAAASVIGLIEAAAKIGSTCVKYSLAVKHSKADILRLQEEVRNLEQVLKQAQKVYETSNCYTVEASTVQCLTRCKNQLAEITAKLQTTRSSRLGTRLKLLDQLSWPLKKKEVDELIRNLENSKQSISIAIQIDQLAILKDIQIGTNSALLPIAEGASFDSFSDQLSARCHARTRIALRQQIRDWFEDFNGSCIFWLSGMAGTGKSTILRSMAQEFHDRHQLGATFFFKRGEGVRGNASRFFTTIASQLARNSPRLGMFIREVCKGDPYIYDKTMLEQFRCLIKEPMAKYQQGEHTSLLIVVDALDECEGEGDTRLIIQLLAEIGTSSDRTIRLLLSSRPETPIRATFGQLPDTKYMLCTLHELSDNIKQDIEIYLRDELSGIQRNAMYNLPNEWPTDQQIQRLVTMAEPLFIAAATICRFISDSRWDPEEQLELLLSYQKPDHFSPLELIYQPILDQMLTGLNESQKLIMLADFETVVGTVVVLEDALSTIALAALLDVSRKFITSRLSMLHSVLRIPTQEIHAIRLLHLSFRDFLTMDAREGSQFWIHEMKLHQRTGQACLHLLSTTPYLKQDICDTGKPGIERRTIDENLVAARIPPEIRYASRYWNVNNHELKSFLGDAISFMSRSGNMFDLCPLQLYSSGLIFTSNQSAIRTAFEKEIPSWTSSLPKALDLYDDSSPMHARFTSGITYVALSPDEKQLATGSWDGSITLWTTNTGHLEHTLQGHQQRRVEFIAYIKHGARLASHAYDGRTIILWSSKTGSIEQVIEVGSNIHRACISHNRQFLVCLFSEAVELWDMINVRKVRTVRAMDAHLVQFSENDKQLAIAYNKSSIVLIDISDNTQVLVIEEAISPRIMSLALSPVGNLLAVERWDKLRIFSMSSGQLVCELDGPCGGGLVFFPDGSRLISLSFGVPRSALVWDCARHCLDANYENYEGPMAFSRDGTWLSIMSKEGLVAIVNTSTAVIEQSQKCPSGTPETMFLLEDGRHIVFQYEDSIKLCQLNKDAMLYSIKCLDEDPSTILFSPNGQYLALQTGNSNITVCDVAGCSVLYVFQSKGELSKFSPTSQYIVVRKDEGIELWNSLKGNLHICLTIPGVERFQESIEFVLDDSQLIVFNKVEGFASFWSATTGLWINNLHDNTGSLLNTIAVSPNGKQLAIGYKDSTLQIWDLLTSTIIHALPGQESTMINTIGYSPSGKHILCKRNSDLAMYDLDTACIEWTFESETFSTSVSFSIDGRLIADLSLPWRINVLDATSGKLLKVLHDPGFVNHIEFPQNQQYLESERGTLSLEQGGATRPPNIPSHVFFKFMEGWLTVDGQNVLWIPPLYQPIRSALHKGKVACLYVSGEIVLWDLASGLCQNLRTTSIG